ncbi:MAG: phosphate signaling complex protein PhoU [Opitutales bacterium]
MYTHLKKDLEKLRSQILKVATCVEENLRKTMKAIKTLSLPMAQEVIQADKIIDKLEVETEEECLKILALHQPVAGDLRYVITVLKINNELEHIGDLAVNIAEKVSYILDTKIKLERPTFDMETMTSRTLYMLKSAIDSFLHADVDLAIGVCKDDEIVDNENRKSYVNLEEDLKINPQNVHIDINYLLVSKTLERIADLCTNIASDVIYMKSAVIARHNLEETIRQIEAGA